MFNLKNLNHLSFKMFNINLKFPITVDNICTQPHNYMHHYTFVSLKLDEDFDNFPFKTCCSFLITSFFITTGFSEARRNDGLERHLADALFGPNRKKRPVPVFTGRSSGWSSACGLLGWASDGSTLWALWIKNKKVCISASA